ncbi:fatty acid CoA ligase family protein [Nocardia otitidiscaviarum]|uniref:fatty acid CoA ligase family protein n=1 Tax=Nocardia otitidiscaviarum TaxID=1823 RepID=UPI00189361FB|nr:fatty acid CoA ligase family protein [Nocardia otitidiscaviarum]MBF6177358.1 AMP-binding protein [Nocardia otitidiscaviarum]
MTAATYWRALDRFRDIVAAHPDREAVIYADGRNAAGLPDYRQLTYAELDSWSDAVAANFLAAGVGRGMRTIVLVRPGPELYAVLNGLFKIGAVPVIIDPGMGLFKMMRCLQAADAEAFVGVPEAQAVRIVFRAYFRKVRLAVTVGRGFWRGPTLDSWGRTPPAPLPEREPAPDDEPLLIAYTTGSTGPAKAVVLTHGNLSAMIEQVDAAREHMEPGTSLITAPVAGILELLIGSRCVLPPLIPSKVGATDPEHVVDAVHRFGVKTMFASPAVLIPLLRHIEQHGSQLPTLESIYSGGAPVPDWCIAGLRAVLPEDAKVYSGYGATEALPMATIESRELLGDLVEAAHRGEGVCVGKPALHVRARIIAITDDPLPTWHDVDERAEELAATDWIGELVVSGPNVSTRYLWPDSANTVGKIRDGEVVWHRTGDLARIDDQGRIRFCGRKSQRVETADGPLFTVRVEQVFNVVSGVARTALVGVGERGAQRPVLCVELEPDADRKAVEVNLRKRQAEFEITAPVTAFLFNPGFPVDIRHNAKIGREKLAVWAAKQLDV